MELPNSQYSDETNSYRIKSILVEDISQHLEVYITSLSSSPEPSEITHQYNCMQTSVNEGTAFVVICDGVEQGFIYTISTSTRRARIVALYTYSSIAQLLLLHYVQEPLLALWFAPRDAECKLLAPILQPTSLSAFRRGLVEFVRVGLIVDNELLKSKNIIRGLR